MAKLKIFGQGTLGGFEFLNTSIFSRRVFEGMLEGSVHAGLIKVGANPHFGMNLKGMIFLPHPL